MTKDSVYKGQTDKGPRAFTKPLKPRDSVTKPIHQFNWPQDRSYEVVYEVVALETTEHHVTIKANSYAQAAWKVRDELQIGTPYYSVNLLDVIRLS